MLKTIIDSDQTGFMPQRTTDVDLRRLYTNIHTHHIQEGATTVAPLDIEKAFDTIEWLFLWEILRRMGFPLVFIKWVQIIYRKPMSAVKLGGKLSSFFFSYIEAQLPFLSGTLRDSNRASGRGSLDFAKYSSTPSRGAGRESSPVC